MWRLIVVSTHLHPIHAWWLYSLGNMDKKLCSSDKQPIISWTWKLLKSSSSCSICILKNEDLWDILSKLMFLAPGLETPMFTPTTNVASSGLPIVQCCQPICQICIKNECSVKRPKNNLTWKFREINLQYYLSREIDFT